MTTTELRITREEAIAELRKHGHDAYTMGSPMGASKLYVSTGPGTCDSIGYADVKGMYLAAEVMAWLATNQASTL